MSGHPGGMASHALQAAGAEVTATLPPPLRPTGIMALRIPFIEMIWRAKGAVALPQSISADEAFARLDPLFQTPGTRYVVEGDRLDFAKHNPAAQDRLATFTHGNLRIEHQDGQAWLRFEAASMALLLTFLAPLLFLGFALLAETLNEWEKASVEASAMDESKDKDEFKDKDKAKDEDKPVRKLNPIDEMLGAPQPEDPGKKKDEKKDEGPHKTDRAYYLAGIFLAIFLVGRMLEPWLLRRTFRKALEGSAMPFAGAAVPPDGQGTAG